MLEHWQRVVDEPDQPQQYRLNVLHRDGTHITMEVNGLGTVVDGEFAGGHESVRDIRERVPLEEGLRSRRLSCRAPSRCSALGRDRAAHRGSR